jgi:SAM-dependent methyltransferase
VEGYTERTYGDAFADVYDEWYPFVGDTDAAVEFLHQLGPSQRGASMLELGVGTGRLALPLAARGNRVVGVDTSVAMLDRLAAKDPAGSVERCRADMTDGLPPGPFDVVFVAYNTLFNLSTSDAQQQCISHAGARLAAAGTFVIEAFVPDPDPNENRAITVRSIDVDRVVLTASIVDAAAQLVSGQHIEITETGGVRLRPWRVRWSTPEQLDAMAAAAGLALDRRLADWSGGPYHHEAARHISVYRHA